MSRDRYAQCDDTCTVDCGACKGAGRPMTADLTPAQAARVDAIEAAPYAEEAWSAEADALACRFHETYERLAPEYGYRTREASAVPWEDVPAANRVLMTAVCKELLAVAAIDVMRGAADDGAIGRVLALADELLRVAQDSDGITATVYRQNADRIRAAVGEPATAEGDDRG